MAVLASFADLRSAEVQHIRSKDYYKALLDNKDPPPRRAAVLAIEDDTELPMPALVAPLPGLPRARPPLPPPLEDPFGDQYFSSAESDEGGAGAGGGVGGDAGVPRGARRALAVDMSDNFTWHTATGEPFRFTMLYDTNTAEHIGWHVTCSHHAPDERFKANGEKSVTMCSRQMNLPKGHAADADITYVLLSLQHWCSQFCLCATKKAHMTLPRTKIFDEDDVEAD